MESMKKDLYGIKPLSYSNYASWSFQMQCVLEEKDLWNSVTTQPPAEPTEDDKKKASQAYRLIGLAVDADQTVHISQLANKTGKSAWDALKAIHCQSSLTAQCRITRKMNKAELTEGKSMRQHIDFMLNCFAERDEIGEPISEGEKVILTLTSLGPEYNALATALTAWETSRLTMPNVTAKLMEEYDKLVEQKETSKETEKETFKEKAMETSSTSVFKRLGPKPTGNAWRESKSDGKTEFLCHCCRQPGHIRRDCPQWKIILRNMKEENKGDRANKEYSCISFLNKAMNCKKWIVDSGCTKHMTGIIEIFTNMKPHRCTVVVANGEEIEAHAIGEIFLKIDEEYSLHLKNVLWVPDLNESLISVRQLTEEGYTLEFTKNETVLKSERGSFKLASKQMGQYRIELANMCTDTAELCIHDWHRKLAHRNLGDIRKLSKEINIRKCDCSDDCEACLKGKMARYSFPQKAKPTKEILDCIVSDVCGPFQIESHQRKRYFLTFIDVYSGYTTVEFIREKGEVPDKAIEFLNFVNTQFKRYPKVFRTDRGSEYLNGKLRNYLKEKGIKTQCTVGYAPQQNGVAERKNRTLMEAARSMLIGSSLPKTFWAEAVNTACYVQNRMPGKRNESSPFETFFGEKPTLTNMHIFGNEAFVKVPDVKRNKLDDKAKLMKFLGYDNEAKGFRMLDENYKVVISRDVHFLSPKAKTTVEAETERKDKNENTINKESELSFFEFPVKSSDDEEIFFDAESEIDHESESEEENNLNSNRNSDDSHISSEDEAEEELPRRTTRSNAGHPPARYADFELYAAKIQSKEPKTFKEAMESEDAEDWKRAMEEELMAIKNNETWELVDLPKGRKAIGCKWVFKNKEDENGNIVRRKTRLVAQGFSQKYGVDYDEVFAPVVRGATFRLLLSIAGVRNYQVKHYDVKTAFLNGRLEEEIFMKQPPGFKTGEQVYRLKKSLYGLKQAARVWNQTLNDSLISNGFTQNKTDKCLYTKTDNESVCHLLVHVDDLLVAYNDEKLAEEAMTQVGMCFELKDLGEVRHYLGINVERSDGVFRISQEAYVDKIIKEAGLEDAKISRIPVDTGYFKQEGKLLPTNAEYRQLIGMLLYLATHTRPDIAASISILSKRVESPRDNDLNEVRRIIRYLKGTRSLKLELNAPDENEELYAHSDSNWGEDGVDRKSTTGFIVSANQGTIAWMSRKQDIVALSSCEAEYVALTETTKELIWLIGVATDLGMKIKLPVTIHTDSQSCISMIANEKFSNRTKHIDVRYHFVRDQIANGRIQLKYCPTEENVADILTKPLGTVKTAKMRSLMRLRDCANIPV